MKILLFNPPMYDQRKYGKPLIHPYGPPHGIAYLTSTLSKANYDVKAYDLCYLSWQEVNTLIVNEKPDIVGITCLTEQRAAPIKLVQTVKAINDNITTIMGGIHSTILYDQVLQHYPVDFVILGEGEETLLELTRALESGNKVADVAGIAFKKDGKIVKTEPRKLIEDLDSIPFPAYNWFNLDSYEKYEILQGEYKGRDVKSLRFVPIIASRGCVGTCQFCSTPKFWGQRWRVRSIKNVVDEIEYLKNEYNCGFFNFADDIFTVRKERIVELCKEIMDRKLDILWDCETRVNFIWDDMLEWMYEAGCYCISFGVESASPIVIKEINKKTNPEQIENAFLLTKKYGIKTKMLLMIGNPGECDESVNDTKRMIEKVAPDFVSISNTMVFPGTKLYELASKQGLVDDSYWLSDKPAPYYTVENDIKQMFKWSDQIMSANRGKFEQLLRKTRTYIEDKSGVRITSAGIEYRKDGKIKKRIGW